MLTIPSPLFFSLPLKLEGYQIGMLILFFFCASLLSLLFYLTRNTWYWKNGIFPPHLKATEKNIFEAYTSLGALILSINRETTKEKITYIEQYCRRYFDAVNGNFRQAFTDTLRNPVSLESITKWMNKNLPQEGLRSQSVYFLTGVAMVDGELSSRELAFLKKLNSQLGLAPNHLDQILSIFASQQEKEKTSVRSAAANSTLAYQILGLMQGATLEEIKSAYRRLAKLHHPDNFATASLSQQRIATEKFIEIQSAFEQLMGNQ